MKNQKECHQALCEGKTLIYQNGEKIRYNEEGCQIIQYRNNVEWHLVSRHFIDPENWQIYEEPTPSASYEEAIAAKKVRIHWPPEGYCTEPEILTRGFGWISDDLCAFDLATRRHYHMEVVE